MTRTGLLVLPVLLLVVGASRLPAQDSLATPAESIGPAPPKPAADSLVRQPRVSPLGALWRSLLIPGWGQAKLGRRVTAAVFVTAEGVFLGMTLKAKHEQYWLESIGDPRQESKRKEVQDWMVLLVFNHLLSGLEAFAAAHLSGFPGDLQLRAAPAPDGGVTAELRLPLPGR